MARNLDKKTLLFTLKHAPWMLGVGYFVQLILSCFGITSTILSVLFGQSILVGLVLILFYFSLGYCFWHRLPLYYMFSANILNIHDFYFGIPVSTKWMLIIYLLLAGILVLIGCIMKNKQHVKERNSKEISTRNSR